ncbi:MAG: endolytic transglycosylase MltG [Patescibacteria group bacterium]|nr:endolytic transglycosylase MltG [Patescibacteria group bacterium]
MENRKLKIKNVLIYLIFGAVVLSSVSLFVFSRNLKQPASRKDEVVVFEIKSGQGVREITKSLEEKSLLKHPTTFLIYLKYAGLNSKIKAGVYSLNKNMNILQVAEALTQGKVSTSRITIPEGWKISEIADYLEKNQVVSKNDFLKAANGNYLYDFLKDKPVDASLEGYLFPDTYFLSANPSGQTIVEKMLDNFNKKFNQELRDKAASKGYTVHEVLTIASVLEKEVRTDSDRAIVAGILYKRMANDMLLEVDSTINFITGKNDPQASEEDLLIDSPYNTYKYKGLPPGPIGNPGLSAIQAALNPVETDYWYYLNRQDTKETIFSRTFEEHLANKEKYLR